MTLFLNWIIINFISHISNSFIMCISIRSCFLNSCIIFIYFLTQLLFQIMLSYLSLLFINIILFVICILTNFSFNFNFLIICCVNQLSLFILSDMFLKIFKKFQLNFIYTVFINSCIINCNFSMMKLMWLNNSLFSLHFITLFMFVLYLIFISYVCKHSI